MKFTAGKTGIVVGVGLACLWGVSTGQVRQVGGGQALDASLQVGSGGVNYAVPQNYAPNTGMSDLTQSRGLSAFKGHAPSISNQLSTGVSTDGVDRFNRQSVSVQDAVRGGPALYAPQTTTYDSPLTTYLRPSDIVQAGYGRRVPIAGGTPVSKNVKLAEDLYVDAMANFKPVMPANVDDMMVGSALSLPQSQGGTETPSQTKWMQTIESRQLADRGGRDMFGMLRQEDRANLAQEISDFDKADEAPGTLNPAVLPLEGTGPIEPVDPRLQTTDLTNRLESPTGSTSTDLTNPAQQKLQAQQTDAQNLQNQSRQPRGTTQKDLRTGLPQTNSDPYFDMLVQFRQRQLQEQNRAAPGQEGTPTQTPTPTPPNAATPGAVPPGGTTPDGAAPDGTTPEANTDAPQPPMQAMDEALLQRIQTAAPMQGRPRNVELTSNNEIIIHRLAGEADDTFNRYMRRAESAMKSKRFYEAAHQYSLAAAARPTNPMAHLGVCLSNFAANEWLTSAGGLQRAMELFPPLMETKLDLKQLIPIQDWPQQLELMERWVQKVDDQPMMLFLAAFIEYNSGRTDAAKQHAETMLKNETLPKIARAYAQYVTTGKLPADVKPRRRK